MQDLTSLFESLRNNEIQKIEEKSNTKVRLSEDSRFIKFVPGNTYKFRLICAIPKGSERKSPFINKFSHVYSDPINKTFNYVVCPTSEYISGKRGFSECKTCASTNRYYNEGKLGNKTSSELYNMFKRSFNGFVLVYVINDPTNEENNNTFKIVRYGKKIMEFLKKDIFGVDVKTNKIINEEFIGADAFRLDKGYDLIITVGKQIVASPDGKDKQEYNSYSCSFSRNASKINVTADDAINACLELKFDEDFFTKSSIDELNAFYNNYVLKSEIGDIGKEVATNAPIYTSVQSTDEIPEELSAIQEPTKESVNVTLTNTKDDVDDDIDIDSLINEIDDNYKN